jgi:epsilon-lactone hydrolase
VVSTELAQARNLFSDLVAGPAVSLEETRSRYEKLCSVFVVPDDADIVEVDAGGAPAIWVSAPGTAADSVVILLHGGGWVMGSAAGYRSVAYRLSKAANARVLVPDYRLAPEFPYPAALDDCVRAYRWVRDLGGISRIAFVGDSAGGGLVVSAMVKLRDDGDVLPSQSVVLSPVVDLAGGSKSLTERAHLDPLPVSAMLRDMGQAYIGSADPRLVPLASPIYADLAGLPAVLVVVGSHEGLYDDAARLVAELRLAGGEAKLEVGDQMIHVWPIFDFLPEAVEAMERIGNFLRGNGNVNGTNGDGVTNREDG